MSYLRFVQYRVEEMAFRRNDIIAAGQKNFQINPQIRVDLKIEKENYFLIMTAKVENTEEKQTPFDFTVKLFGQFVITEMTDLDTLRKEGSQFLYPYLRATVTNLVSNSNMPPYFLPIIDMEMKKGEPEQKKDDGGIKITPLVDGDLL